MSTLARLGRGQLINVIFLIYYHTYVAVYEIWHRKKFRYTLSAERMGHPKWLAGCFPAHPKVVKTLLRESGINRSTPMLDVGCGAGLALFVAYRMGFTNLHGIELGDQPYNDAARNLSGLATIYHGNALDHDLGNYETIFFFNSFRGEPAQKFFGTLHPRINCVITMNPEPALCDLLQAKGFRVVYEYDHICYKNFSSQVWKK